MAITSPGPAAQLGAGVPVIGLTRVIDSVSSVSGNVLSFAKTSNMVTPESWSTLKESITAVGGLFCGLTVTEKVFSTDSPKVSVAFTVMTAFPLIAVT